MASSGKALLLQAVLAALILATSVSAQEWKGPIGEPGPGDEYFGGFCFRFASDIFGYADTGIHALGWDCYNDRVPYGAYGDAIGEYFDPQFGTLLSTLEATAEPGNGVHSVKVGLWHDPSDTPTFGTPYGEPQVLKCENDGIISGFWGYLGKDSAGQTVVSAVGIICDETLSAQAKADLAAKVQVGRQGAGGKQQQGALRLRGVTKSIRVNKFVEALPRN